MDQLNNYLQQFTSIGGGQLRLQPNRTPYVVSKTGNKDLGGSPLAGSLINSMVFSLIPDKVKQQLPDQKEVKFTHPHTLGNFDFSVQKSPEGFNVTVNMGAPKKPIEPQSSATKTNQAPIERTVQSRNASPQPPISPKMEMDSLDYEIEIIEPVPQQEKQAPVVSAPEVKKAPVEINQPQIISDAPSTTPAPASTPVVSVSNQEEQSKMNELFKKMANIGASDLHMSVSMPPMVRKDGKMAKLEESQAVLTPDSIKTLLSSIMPQKNIDEFAQRKDTDFAYEIPGLARFRANIFMDRKGMGGVFRIIPSEILTAEDLKLSDHILKLCDLSKGLVVVTGPTGSGKSTTLCAMVDYINKRREDHIITIEDPIEFTHENNKCLVNQREVHNHTDSFKDALRAALREDPDILLVGEMRDLETISIAIETAETGHLVFGTLHTTTAASTVDRIIDQFPADRQQQIRVMLSESLQGVISQTLLPKIGGGRVAALEVLIVTPAISNLIREGKTFQIPSAMQTGKQLGMVMLNDALIDLVKAGKVEARDAYIKAVDKTGFELLMTRNKIRM